MTIVAHAYPFVIGVDTHARNHVLSILVAATGAVVDEAQFPTTAAGMTRAVDRVGRRTGGDLAVLWVIECVGSYGAGLASVVTKTGYQAVEAARMNAGDNRGVGKSDPLDARRIARSNWYAGYTLNSEEPFHHTSSSHSRHANLNTAAARHVAFS